MNNKLSETGSVEPLVFIAIEKITIEWQTDFLDNPKNLNFHEEIETFIMFMEKHIPMKNWYGYLMYDW